MAFEAILYLAILILGAKAFGEILHRLKQPTLLGNVIGGIIIGPAVFGLVSPVDEIDLFISIGVFFLFFLIGLEEIDVPGLFRVLKKRIFAGAAIAFLIPFVVAGLFGMSLEMGFVKSFALAAVIGASSLGVTAKILTDLGKLRSTIGLQIFTMTAIVEFIAIIFASVMVQIDVAGDTPQLGEILWLFVKMILFFGIAGLLSVFVLPHFLHFIKENLKVKEIYFGTIIGIILLVAYFAEISGIHGSIGALLLGVAVSRMPRSDYLEVTKSIRAAGHGLFIPIFFAGIGIHFIPEFLELPVLTIAGFIVIIVGVKFLGSYVAVRYAKLRPSKTVAYGVMSKGAVDLALLLTLLEYNIIKSPLFSLLVFGTLVMMIVSAVNLQSSIRKYLHVKVGTVEIGLLPVYFRNTLSNFRASDVMNFEFDKIASSMTISEFTKEFPEYTKDSFLVFGANSNLIGIVSKKEIDKVKKNVRNQMLIGTIANTNFMTVKSDEYLFSVVQKLNSLPYNLLPVLSEDNKVVGIVKDSSLMNLFIKEEKNKK